MSASKVFEGATLEEAFGKVRAELGSEAFIYETKRKRAPGLLGLMGRWVVQVVAGTSDGTAGWDERFRSREAKAISELLSEVLALRQAVDRLSTPLAFEEVAHLSRPLRGMYHRLLQHRYPEGAARELVLKARDDLSPHEARQDDRVLQILTEYLVGAMATPKPLELSRPQVLFVTGPTGSGKTTTVSKLAVGLALKGKKVVVINADTLRPGATAQLKAYTDLLGVPCEVAYSAEELAKLVGRYRGRATVLVDTPGRNPRSTDQLSELRALLEAVQDKNILLTVPAVIQKEEMNACLDVFGFEPLYGLVVTKLDEASALGPLVAFLQERSQPVVLLSTGPRVPEDLKIADNQFLVAEMLSTGRDG